MWPIDALFLTLLLVILVLLIFWLLSVYDFPLQLKHLYCPLANSSSSELVLKHFKNHILGFAFRGSRSRFPGLPEPLSGALSRVFGPGARGPGGRRALQRPLAATAGVTAAARASPDRLTN